MYKSFGLNLTVRKRVSRNRFHGSSICHKTLPSRLDFVAPRLWFVALTNKCANLIVLRVHSTSLLYEKRPE